MLHVLKKVSSMPEKFHLVPAAAGGTGGGYTGTNRTGIKYVITRKYKKAPEKIAKKQKRHCGVLGITADSNRAKVLEYPCDLQKPLKMKRFYRP